MVQHHFQLLRRVSQRPQASHRLVRRLEHPPQPLILPLGLLQLARQQSPLASEPQVLAFLGARQLFAQFVTLFREVLEAAAEVAEPARHLPQLAPGVLHRRIHRGS